MAAADFARGQAPNEDSATGTKDGKNADLGDDDTDAESGIPDDDNNNDLEPMRACYDPFPTAAVLNDGADALPGEYREDDLLFVAWRRSAVVLK